MAEAVGQVYFGIIDYVMLTAMLVISLGIGIYFAFGGKQVKTKFEYLLGSRKMGVIPVTLSLFATFHSAISLLGTPAEVYTYGTMVYFLTVIQCFTLLVKSVTTVPLFYPLKLTSVFEVCYMTIALLSPGLALQTVAGIPLWLSIVLIGLIGTLYTAIGGLKSVVWTDVFQTFIIFGGIILILIKGSYDVGGIHSVMKVASDNGRILFNDVRVDPRVRHTIWGLSLGGFFYSLTNWCSQSTVQRISSIRSQKQASSIPLNILYKVVLILSGLVLVAYFFVHNCDPLAAGYIQSANQLMPFFVMLTLGFLPGFPGVYIATIFSGALSLSLRRSDHRTGLPATFIRWSVTQLTYSVFGATNAPLAGLFFLGATFPQAEVVGGFSGIVIGLTVSTWLTFGSYTYGAKAPKLPLGSTMGCARVNISSVLSASGNISTADSTMLWTMVTTSTTGASIQSATINAMANRIDKGFSMYDLSYVWSPFIGTLVTVFSGLCCSLVYRMIFKPEVSTDPSLLFPWAKSIWRIKDVPIAAPMEPSHANGNGHLRLTEKVTV
ncbi:Sodium-dependent multivitamin transporter [Bulinus truncatus]|nr:Sodium-dependent multivitamin transporter [Bulinus truncatus]